MSHNAEKADNRVIAYISAEELACVDKLAKSKRVSRSWVLREAVIKFLESEEGPLEHEVKA